MNKVFSIFKILKLKKLIVVGLLLVLFVGVNNKGFGQAVGDYGTRYITGTNNWNTATNWIVCVAAGTWTGATTAATVPNNTKNVWIRTGSNYTMDGNPAACNNLVVSGILNWTNARTLNANGNLTVIGGTLSGTSTGILNVSGTLTVPVSATASIQRVTIMVSGTTTVAGTLNFATLATGSKTFMGLITIDSGGTWNNSINAPITLRGGITNNGTFTAGTGVYTFNTNSQTLSGTLPIPRVTVTGVTLTNNGILTVGTALIGTGGLTQGSGTSILNIGGTSAIGTLTASISGNTVNYTGAAQTINTTAIYHHLTLSGSGAKTLSIVATTINGNFTMAGTATTTGRAALTIGGNVTIGIGTTFASGNFTHNVAGNWTNNGGTFTPGVGTGTVRFTGNSSTINGTATTQTFYNIIVAKTAGQTLNVGGSTTALTIGGSFTETSGNFTAPATITLTGDLTLTSGTFTAGANLATRGNWTSNGGTFSPGTGTVTFNGIATAINGSAANQTFNNIVSAKNTNTALSVSIATLNVRGIFTETSGNFTAPANMLVSGNMIFTTGTFIAGTNLSASGNMTFTAGTFIAGTNLSVSGNWTRNGGTFTPGTGTVTFSGNTAAINGTVATQTFNNFVVAKVAGQTLSVGGSTTTLNVNGTFTETTGNFTAPATMRVTGNWTNNGGTFAPGTGTVTFSGNTAAINGTAASQSFNNIVVSKTAGQTLSVGGSTTTLNVGGNFTETTGNFTAPATMTVTGNLIFTAGTFTSGANLSVSGNWTKNGGAFTSGTGTVTFNGAAETIGGSTSTTFNNLTLGGTGTKIFARATTTSGSFSIINGVVVNLSATLTHTSGTLSLGGAGQSAGTWGGTGSAATNKNSTYFANVTGILTVTSSSSCAAGSWTGYTNTDWNTATNWCIGTVPTASTNVVIPSGGNQPVIGAAGGLCNNITINSGATLSITGSGSMTVSGNWTNNGGTFTPGTGTVSFTGNNSVINGTWLNQTFYNVNVTKTAGQTLSIGSTATLNVSNNLTISMGALTIPPGALLSVTNVSNLNSNPSLVLKSDATLTGSFVYNTFSGIGTVKVERFMSKSDNWHLYSSPISNQSIKNFLLNNPEIPDLHDASNAVIGVGMRDYNTATDLWNSYLVYATASTTPGSIGGGKGFSIRTYNDAQGTGSVDAIGTPNPNTINVTLTRSAASTDNGWNCIGNPYTSALNIIGFLTANSAQLEPGFEAVYVWDTNNIIPGKSSPDYVVLNNASTITNVQIAQGFFLKSKTGGGIVTFTKTMQNPSAGLTFKDAVIEWPSLKIIASNQTVSSSTEIKFVTNTTKGLDPGYDAGMLKANPDFSLYSRLVEDDGIDFTLQCLPDQDYDQYEIPIGIDFKLGGEITFTAESVNLPSGCQALLEDRVTHRFTRLDLKDAKYNTNVTPGTKGTGRFYLHTSDVISSNPRLAEQSFKVYTIGKTVYVNGAVSTDAQFALYSVNGKLLANFKAESQVENRLDASGLPSGVYVLLVSDKNVKKSVKLIIEQ